MPDEIDSTALAQSWTHAHEEDEGDRMVFRPSDQPFPPARGRRSLDLRPGGSVEEIGPGPDDRRLSRTGSWSLEGRVLTLSQPGREDERFRVEAVDDERLVVRSVT